MKRCKKLMLEAEEGIIFEVSETSDGGLIVRTRRMEYSTYSENYANPVIPEGYLHICGEWYNGFVIERISDGSQFVWVPVGSIEANGMLDGVSFTEKFGRRNYRNDEFSEDTYHESLTEELEMQIGSVKKYGGFYISRYNISQNKQTGAPQSVQGVIPWTNVSFDEAKKVAASIEDSDVLKSHLTFGSEYDSILEWLIATEARTLDELIEDSTQWGNYWNTENSPRQMAETGSCTDWCANNVFDLAGNVEEWTQEEKGSEFRTIRGGFYQVCGSVCSAGNRYCRSQMNRYGYTGFRVSLYIR